MSSTSRSKFSNFSAPLAIGTLAIAIATFAVAPSHTSALQPGGGTFVVDSEVDAVDANPGDGICSTAAGECTFRAAVQETNVLSGHQTIKLPPGDFLLAVEGLVENDSSAGDIDVLDALSIIGAGVSKTAISENVRGVERVLDVRESATVVIHDLTIHDVFMSEILPFEEDCGGGIRNFGDLTAFRLIVRDNQFRRSGGGICNHGTLNLSDSLIQGNVAALTGPGGGVLNTGVAVLERLVISLNRGDTTGGGGIGNYGSMMLRDSVVTENSTDGDASGAGGIDNRGAVTIINSTISANRTEGSRGGGLSNQDDSSLTLINSTVTSNDAGRTASGGISTDEGSTTTLINTIVAGNENFDCQQGEPFFGGALPISGGHNIDSDGSCQLSGPGDQSNADPLLGPLADNGGPTFTHALLDGSPAIDAGDDAECPSTDQRGAPRPAGEACDIGAYEAGSQVPPPPESIQGDADCDGAISPLDALAILQSVAGFAALPCPAQADVNCDGVVDAVDALFILRFIAALPVNLPDGCPPIGSG